MKPYIALVQLRKHIARHPYYYSFCAGSIVTSTTIALLTRNVDLLQVPKDQLEMLKNGGGIVYELRGQTLHLVNLAAVEAQAAAL